MYPSHAQNQRLFFGEGFHVSAGGEGSELRIVALCEWVNSQLRQDGMQLDARHTAKLCAC